MEFDGNRTLKIHPPDGEFIAMNYRITSDFEPPFRVVPVIEEISAYKLELTLKVKANFPKQVVAGYFNCSFPLPKSNSNVTFE